MTATWQIHDTSVMAVKFWPSRMLTVTRFTKAPHSEIKVLSPDFKESEDAESFESDSLVCLWAISWIWERMNNIFLPLIREKKKQNSKLLIITRVYSSANHSMGCSRKKSTPPRLMAFWIENLAGGGGGGSKTLEIQVGGGLNMIKSSAGVISTDCSCDSNV